MDPQKLSQLDPKLREAYQRVMETSVPQPQAPQSQPVSEPQPAINPEPPVQAANFVQMNSEVVAAPMAQVQTMAIKKKKGMMMPILFGIAGFILIAVYTFFWAKIFNFKLPFLP